MKTKSRVSRASKIAVAVAFGGFAMAAQADPWTLQAVCHLTSIIAGQGQCQLEYILQDDFATPATIRLGLIKIDNIVVAQYNNDRINPATGSGFNAGVTLVSCNATHTVLAYIARNTPTSLYEAVGTVPPIRCWPAP